MADLARNRVVTPALRLSALLLLLAGTACTPLDDAMVSVFGRSMREQASIGSYENPLMPPEGSVSFASGNFPAGPGEVNVGQPEGAAVPEPITNIQVAQALLNPDNFPQITGLENPVPVTPASLARGEQVFNRACSPCHGSSGTGDGPVSTVVPIFGTSLLSDQARGFVDGYIYSIIRAGRGAMPAYGHQISHFDRWHVVNYVRQLQGQ
ncbi:MAG: cytochrome c [Gemmatimonadota bacterium]